MSWLARGALAAALALYPAASGGQALDPSATGPLAVTSDEYKIPGVLVPDIPYPVDVWAVVWYPAGLPAGPYPLLLFLHGNHGICRQGGLDGCSANPPNCPPGTIQTPNHRGYDYIAERLASWGYVVASINANAINCRSDGIPERGRLVQEHLRRWAAWSSPEGAAPFGVLFSGKVDLGFVGLMGHSRGGEGVRAAYNFNRADGAPFGVKAVFEIGPVDFGPLGFHQVFNADGVNFSVLLPGCDNDVSDLQGMRAFDRAQAIAETNPTPKAQQFIWGANHNFFNSEWDDEAFTCIGQTRLSRADQEQVGRVYVMGFFRGFIGGEGFGDLFTRDVPPPASVPTLVDNAYTESPSAILLVNDFSGSVAGAFVGTNVALSTCSGFACGFEWLHDASKFALSLAWPETSAGPTPSLALDLAPGGLARDVSQYAFLSFRVTQRNLAINPGLPGSQDFTVRLVDGAGEASAGALAAEYAFIHFPIGPFQPITLLETVRIPLAAFAGADLGNVRSIRLDFDREPDGGLLVSDFAFSPRPRGALDEFLCTRARTTPRTPPFTSTAIRLTDEFEDAGFDAVRPVGLCNPADLGGAALGDPLTALAAYDIRRAEGTPPFARQRFVRIDDALGQLVVDAVRPDRLLVPTAESTSGPPAPPDPRLHHVDHFKCYRTRPSSGALPFPSGLQVSVGDAFTSPPKVLNVRRPRHLCLPVAPNGETIEDPSGRLLCYTVRVARGQPRRAARSGVHVGNRFPPELLDTTREQELCVPSRKVP